MAALSVYVLALPVKLSVFNVEVYGSTEVVEGTLEGSVAYGVCDVGMDVED